MLRWGLQSTGHPAHYKSQVEFKDKHNAKSRNNLQQKRISVTPRAFGIYAWKNLSNPSIHCPPALAHPYQTADPGHCLCWKLMSWPYQAGHSLNRCGAPSLGLRLMHLHWWFQLSSRLTPQDISHRQLEKNGGLMEGKPSLESKKYLIWSKCGIIFHFNWSQHDLQLTLLFDVLSLTDLLQPLNNKNSVPLRLAIALQSFLVTCLPPKKVFQKEATTLLKTSQHHAAGPQFDRSHRLAPP